MRQEKKTSTITIRCTPSQRSKMQQKADDRGMSLGSYMVDCGVAGCQTRGAYKKRVMCEIVTLQQICNDMNECLNRNDESIPKQDVEEILFKLKTEVGKLWRI